MINLNQIYINLNSFGNNLITNDGIKILQDIFINLNKLNKLSI